MPFDRPTLTDLQSQVAQDIASSLPGADALLRFANLTIMGKAQANLANLHYGYLDWIAKQAVPFTAEYEFLEGWAALKGIFRKPAISAAGFARFPGVVGTSLSAGTSLVRGDGVTYAVTTGANVDNTGYVTVAAVADADPTGQGGAFGDAEVGTVLTLGTAIAGIQSNGVVSTAFTGGADIEQDDSLRSRMLQIYQNPPQGGAAADYVTWALEVPGVTRAWSRPQQDGAGTVAVYVMLDITRAVNKGFPQGANGVAAADNRAPAATGDQLVVANYIYNLQPVTALVRVYGASQNAVNFSIKGVPNAAQAAVAAAIDDAFVRLGAPGGTVPLAQINSAIASVSGAGNFVILSPSNDIANAAGSLPVRGTITWS